MTEQDSGSEPTPAEVRAWAKRQDMGVGNTGRMPSKVYDAYREAHRS